MSDTPGPPDAVRGDAELDVADSLRGERIFITGATGFVGKVLVERLLSAVPEVRLSLLIRPGDRRGAGERGAGERLRDEVLGSPIFARLRALHGDGWPDWAASRVQAVAGDLRRERFGLGEEAWAELCGRIDRVVSSAATVAFDERLDLALEVNARGALRPLELARDAGGVPLVHVSTCFVSGRRKGWVDERPPGAEGGPDLDLDAVLAALDARCRELRDGAGGLAGATSAWVAAGREQAAHFGFHDVYTLTKALGERLVARHRGEVPVAIVRPAIVESALARPTPGWIEAVRVADPLLVAYGRGRTRVLPGAADLPLELVPVDFVAHAVAAALAALGRGGVSGEIPVYQLGSSRHPITLGELLGHAREGFAATPLRDAGGEPIAVAEARFVEPGRLARRLEARRRRLRRLGRAVARLGAARLAPRMAPRLTVAERTLEHFQRLTEVYRPYLSPGARYRDDAARALWDRLTPASKEDFPFDVEAIDWRRYVGRVHVPGLVRFALGAENGAPPVERPESPAGRLAEAAARAAEARTLYELFAAVARDHPEAVALQTHRDGRWLRYTYGQALTATANVARRLAGDYGIGRGDRVVLWASGSPEWVIAAFAVHRLGAAVVPLDPQWPAVEVAEAARLVGAGLICVGPRPGEADLGAAKCPAVALAAPFVPEPDVGLLPGAEAAVADETASSDLAAILFTSGTTVRPKAVPLTHANYLANVRDLVPLMELTGERLLSVLPIHHAFEQTVGLLVPMAGASTVSYVAELRPAEISWMMSATRPTVLVAVPRLLELLHNGIFQSVRAGGPMLGLLFRALFALSRWTGGRWGHRLFGKVHRRFGGSLRRIATGGSALEPALGRSFQLMGFSVAEGYGMTETSPVLTVNPWRAIRFGSAGRPLPGVEIELRPPAEGSGAEAGGVEPADLEPGAGEIWVRGANVMSGYYGDPESGASEAGAPETGAEVLRDGWLNTGDVGRFDADGYLYLAGRTKDVIVTGAGKNVYPEEVELRYRELPEVAELVVLGLPPEGGGGGEQVAAVVVPRPGAGAEAPDREERIRAAIAARSAGVPSYQRIGRVVLWRGELPKTTTLKVRRGELRAAVLAGEDGTGATPPSRPAPAAEPASPPPSEAESWAIATVARLTRTRADRLRPDHRLADLGVDSLTLAELVGEIEARRGTRLDGAEVAALERVRDLCQPRVRA